jgi:hypothetical protein
LLHVPAFLLPKKEMNSMASLMKEGYGGENLKNILYTLQKIYQEVQFWVVTPRSITATQQKFGKHTASSFRILLGLKR